MQKDIEELQPKLVIAQKEAEEFIEVCYFAIITIDFTMKFNVSILSNFNPLQYFDMV